ncbi:MAG: ABC transporter substrate-binding protein [Chloroflexota bacterium]|nr:ABC transporter substrate-binding protein [Chloroflexota bacterium]
MRWKRILMSFSVLAAALLVVSLVAACGGGGAKKTPTPAGTPKATTAVTPAATPQGTGTPQKAGSVSVLGIWGSEELDSFNAMVAPWQQQTGGSVQFTGSRSITSELTLRVQGGNPPDVAIPAETGLFQQFASQGRLAKLSDCPGLEEAVKADYPQTFLDLGTVDGTLYGFFMKVDSKATVWYDPKTFSANNIQPLSASNSFDDLVSLSDELVTAGLPPQSIGMEAGDASGFPGTDWIQQIVLNDSGVEVYDGIVDGSIPFTDPRMKDAWEKFGQIALTPGYVAQGSAAAINATNFQDSSYLPFNTPPQAAMVNLGSFTSGFIQAQFPSLVPGEDFNFFTWPGGNITGGANIVYAFNSDPSTCSLLSWLESADAQKIWVARGGFHSVNKNVSLNEYPNDVEKNVAQQLTDAPVFRFDLDDAIGGALQQAYFTGIGQYLANPGQLDSILAQIEAQRVQ